jgi:hypothetical protein
MIYRKIKPLEGIIVPLVTPLCGNNRIDIDGLSNLVEHVVRGGVHGIFILGTTGEAQSLSMSQRAEMKKEQAVFWGIGYFVGRYFDTSLLTARLIKRHMSVEHMPCCHSPIILLRHSRS